MSRSFKIFTLGCKVNQYESAFLEESLTDFGCQKAHQNRPADLVVINTCIVTARASYQSRQAVRKAIRENPEAIIAVIGCYGQALPDEVSEIIGVDVIAGNKGKNSLPQLLANTGHHNPPLTVRADFGKSSPFEETPVRRFSDRTRAFLKIQDGCESSCSYCIVPKARGPLRSLEPDRVIRLLKGLEGSGYKEVVLVGVHLGKYGSDLAKEVDLMELLVAIGRNRGRARVRLSSLEPTEVDEELIAWMAKHDWLCRHVHISLQSGDDEVLRRMNRHYTGMKIATVVDDLARLVPQVSIGADVLVGFPGESEGAFKNTYALLKDLPISYLHVFPYSRREGTAAATFSNQVDHKSIKERAFLLRRLDREKRRAFRYSLLGNTFNVLTEGWGPREENVISGLSDNYVRFAFPSTSLIKNRMVKLKAEFVTEGAVIARRSIE